MQTKNLVFSVLIVLLFTTSAHSWPIPDTGQTKCYDNEKEIPCPKPGEPFYGQDGNYNINPPSYTKLDEKGNELPDDAETWVMVRDNVTGLIWEVKSAKDDVKNYSNPHDADNVYTWYDSNPETNGGWAETPRDYTVTQDFIAALNDASFDGGSDWRLPDLHELYSIIFLPSSFELGTDRLFPKNLNVLALSKSTINGKEITFKHQRGSDSVTLDAPEKISFNADDTVEKDLHFASASLEINFHRGWSWVSFNVIPKDTTIEGFFGDNVSKVIQIKNQTQSATYIDGLGWLGNTDILRTIADGVMFMIKTSESFTLSLSGALVNSNTNIILNDGWTWIGYLPEECKAYDSALSSFIDEVREIKSQTQSVINLNSRFIGTLDNMCPGQGYIIKTSSESTFNYAQ